MQHDPAVILAGVKAMRSVLDDIERETKQRILEQMGPGDRKHARIDGLDCATITVTAPEVGLVVTSPSAFLDWCRKNAPHAIEERVRDSDKRAILDAAKKSGEAPDGVDLGPERRPTVTVRQTDAQAAAFEEAIVTGRISLNDVLALTAAAGS